MRTTRGIEVGKASEAQTGGEGAEGEHDAADQRSLAETEDKRAAKRHISTVVWLVRVEKVGKSL